MTSTEDLAEFAVSRGLQAGVDDIVVQISHSQEKQIKFSNNDITISQGWLDSQLSLFLAKNKRLVSTTIERPTRRKILASLNQALHIAAMIAPKEDYYGIGTGGTYVPSPYDGDMIERDEDMVSITRQVIDTSHEYAPEIAGVLYVGREATDLVSSEGTHMTDKNSWISLSVRALGEEASGHGVACARTLKTFDPFQASQKAGSIAQKSVSPRTIEQGTYDVVFDPLALANLVSHLIDFASIFSLEIGSSFFIDKLGEKVASDHVTLVDDGTHPKGINSQKFDDEGVATRKTEIIKNGVLLHYLHNTSTARKYNTETTGNAGLISPHPWNAVLAPGTYTPEDLFRETSTVLYITNIWYTRFQNYRTGDFSTIPRDGAFLIHKGDIVHPVHNIRISDNLLSLFAHIQALSREQEQIHWWETPVPSFVPYALVKNVNITKPMG